MPFSPIAKAKGSDTQNRNPVIGRLMEDTGSDAAWSVIVVPFIVTVSHE